MSSDQTTQPPELTGCDDWAELLLHIAALRAAHAASTGYVQACDEITAWMNARG